MSTAHETIVAKHAGLKIFAMSLVTNRVIMEDDSKEVTNHEEVLDTGRKRAELMNTVITKMVEDL